MNFIRVLNDNPMIYKDGYLADAAQMQRLQAVGKVIRIMQENGLIVIFRNSAVKYCLE